MKIMIRNLYEHHRDLETVSSDTNITFTFELFFHYVFNNDENQGSQPSQSQTSQPSITIPVGPMTRSKAKEVQESMAGLIIKLRNQVYMEENKMEVNCLFLEAQNISVDRKSIRSIETLQGFWSKPQEGSAEFCTTESDISVDLLFDRKFPECKCGVFCAILQTSFSFNLYIFL